MDCVFRREPLQQHKQALLQTVLVLYCAPMSAIITIFKQHYIQLSAECVGHLKLCSHLHVNQLEMPHM